MGTWGSGNFDNDAAGDFFDSVIWDFHKNVDDCLTLQLHDGFNLDDHGDAILMPSLDILIVLCEHEESPRLPIEKAILWRDTYLKIWDSIIDDYGPKESYKKLRRQVIVKTFDKLLDLVARYPY